MNTHKLPPILIIIIIIFLALAISTKSLPNYLGNYCPNTTTYTTNSTYQTNLKTLLTSLSSNSTVPGGFYNSFVNALGGEVIYGLFLCRGDLSPDTCNYCVTTATKEALQRCPNNKVVILWYDECLLRYSNKTSFSTPNGQPGLLMWNTRNVTPSDQSRFNAFVRTTLTSAAEEATDVPSGVSKKYFKVEETSVVSKKNFNVKEASGASKYFNVKETSGASMKSVKLKETSGNGNFSEFDNIYTLVQCTQDLSADDFESCLEEIIGNFPLCCDGKVGGRVLFPNCNFRYEMYRFYNESSVVVSAPSLSPVVVVPHPSPHIEQPGKGGISTITIVAIVAPIGVFMLLFCAGYCFLSRRSRRNSNSVNEEDDGANGITTVESLQYDLGTIKTATNNFSEENKLGEGGFGDVYKGTLENGQEIAVKRLSSRSMQGALEFKNEVILVAKLQHRHLVRMLGFCLHGEEKILVYEFVPNKSLDYFLFDSEKQGLLYWSQRYKIIEGIARGILYLHQDSRLRIIHRDLKASNILLGGDMKPKISDFGMARIFGVDQTQGNTNRIVGTYGYMSPEYAMHGQFSVKSDVYSFGILVLEIITSKKNSSFYQADGCQDLVSYVWKHWRDETPLEVLDPALGDAYSRNEVVRCIQIGLLCVQENPADRPSMASIVLMLNSYSVSMPLPQRPAFFLSRPFDSFNLSESDQSKSKSVTCSVDEASITEVYPR